MPASARPSLGLLPRLAAVIGLGLLGGTRPAAAQELGGRVFNPTPETVGIWDFDLAPTPPGTAPGDGTVLRDRSGRGRHATIRGNGGGALQIGDGDRRFDATGRPNRALRRANVDSHVARAVVDDAAPFEMGPTDSFSVELYVDRVDVPPAANWGILAGTWHSRNLADDQGDANTAGAWYGYGLIRHQDDGGFPSGGWRWVLSPMVNGVPRIGHANAPELWLTPGFEIPAGRHYVVLVVDRVAQRAVAYVDGRETSRLEPLGADWAFGTPTDRPGRDPARFSMMSGEDDASQGRYRAAPNGAHLDAVRVQRRAMSADEVRQAWTRLDAGAPHPEAVAAHAWSFDAGDARDAQRPSLNGSLQGAPGTVAGPIGAAALSLSGSQWVSYPSHDFGEAFTLSLWIRPDATTPPEKLEALLANSAGGFQTSGFRLFLNSFAPTGAADGRIHFETGDGTAGASARSTPNAAPVDTWTHVAVVVNRAAGRAAIYRDGRDVTEAFEVRPGFNTVGPFDLGRLMASGLMFSGAVDDVRVFPRLLSGAEIDALRPAVPDPDVTVSVRASRMEAAVGQCVGVEATADMLRRGERVERVEWRVGRTGWVEAPAIHALPAPMMGVPIFARVTTNQMRSAEGSLMLDVRAQDVIARIEASVDGVPQPGGPIEVELGARLELDARASSSLPPPGARACPLDTGAPLPPADIALVRWDLDGDRQPDAEGPMASLGPLDRPGRFMIRVGVQNAEGAADEAQREVIVRDPASPPDAGVLVDAGVAVDAGMVADAGAAPDARVEESLGPLPAGSSGCRGTTGEPTSALWALSLGLGLSTLRRRRRRGVARRRRSTDGLRGRSC